LGPRVAQHAEHGDGIGGGDDGAEEQALGEPQRKPAEAGDQQGQPAHEGGREQHAERRQHADQRLLAQQRRDVDLQRAGEQQEREHPLEHRGPKVNAVHEPAGEFVHRPSQRAGRDQRQRKEQAPDRHADRRREAPDLSVELVEQPRRGGHDQQREE